MNNNLDRALPINRDEVFWTSCVLPMIAIGPNLERLGRFLSLLGLPGRWIRNSYPPGEGQLFTEYSLKKSSVKAGNDWKSLDSGRGETPDLVVLLCKGSERFLVFVEAKMFDPVTHAKLRDQLQRQKIISQAIMQKLEISKRNFIHGCLLLEPPQGFEPNPDEKVVRWNEIRSNFKDQTGIYFYELLCDALNRRGDLMGKGVASFHSNMTTKKKGREILQMQDGGRIVWVGRRGGLPRVREDCKDGKVLDRPYEINEESAKKPNKKNWFSKQEFAKVVIQNGLWPPAR